MKRCAACGTFFDQPDCPGDHSHVEIYIPPNASPARLCAACGKYFTGLECPYEHTKPLVDKSLITLGNAVTCDVSGLWSNVDSLPGILVGVDGSQYRVIVSLPGDRGSVVSVTLPAERLS